MDQITLITEEQRKENVKNLMAAVKPIGLDYHTLQLAVIDLSRSSLLYFFAQLPEEQRNAMQDRLEAVSPQMAEILNTMTKSPGEDTMLLYALLEQSVLHGMKLRQKAESAAQ